MEEKKEDGGGGVGAGENETDTFISVDSQLNRVAINCSVHEFGRLKGGVEGRGNHFFPPRQHLQLNTCRPPHPPPNHKYQIKSDSDVQCPGKVDVTNCVTSESLQFRIRCLPLSF